MSSGRTKIVGKLSEIFKQIDGTGSFTTNLFSNSYPKLKFWDEVEDFPFVCVTAGVETREYLPSNFKWAFLTVAVRMYVQGEDSEQLLENLISDVESVIDANNEIEYETGKYTQDIRIISIETDEGLLAPYGVGEMSLTVQYEIV